MPPEQEPKAKILIYVRLLVNVKKIVCVKSTKAFSANIY